MASNTENLNLYKKDPIADKDETFNIQTMMNDNWDRIDQFAGETSSHMAQKAEIIVTQGIPVSQRKEGAFYLIETDQSPITTVENIKVSPMMGLRKE